MVDHPAVLAEVRTEHPGRQPVLRPRDGLQIVTYGRTRVFLDRDAWEMLPADGVLVMRVRTTYTSGYALALTAAELEAVFGEVRATRSWDDIRCYHFAREPPAAAAFRVLARG
jgi:hypothetical protein